MNIKEREEYDNKILDLKYQASLDILDARYQLIKEEINNIYSKIDKYDREIIKTHHYIIDTSKFGKHETLLCKNCGSRVKSTYGTPIRLLHPYFMSCTDQQLKNIIE